MGNLGSTNPGVAFGGNTSLSSTTVANPCGLIAKYIFTDRFAISQGNTSIAIDEKNIAHSVDVKYKFKSPVDASDI